jgi:hypothetical protein
LLDWRAFFWHPHLFCCVIAWDLSELSTSAPLWRAAEPSQQSNHNCAQMDWKDAWDEREDKKNTPMHWCSNLCVCAHVRVCLCMSVCVCVCLCLCVCVYIQRGHIDGRALWTCLSPECKRWDWSGLEFSKFSNPPPLPRKPYSIRALLSWILGKASLSSSLLPVHPAR